MIPTVTLYAKDGSPVIVNRHEFEAWQAAKSAKDKAALRRGESGPDFGELLTEAPKQTTPGA